MHHTVGKVRAMSGLSKVFWAAASMLLWAGTITATESNSGVGNAFHPGELWLDNNKQHINAHGGGILFHNGTYYWFGEHKIAGEAGNTAQVGVHVYSSKNLYDWRDEGIALAVSKNPTNEITQGCILERPKVIFNPHTKKFVMWFHLELKGHSYDAARSGVAVADKAAGPYSYLYSFRPNAGVWPDNFPKEEQRPLTAQETAELSHHKLDGGPETNAVFPGDLICRRDFSGGQMARDMTLFVDDEGKAYHIYSSEENGTIQISQLTDDFLKPAGRYVRVLPGGFNEAPSIFKHDGKYFLFTSGTTGWNPNPCRLSMAESIWGPWKYVGNPCRGATNLVQTTFRSQSTYVLPVPGHSTEFIFMADRWQPQDAIDGRYIWLPIRFAGGLPVLEWNDSWSLNMSEPRMVAEKSAAGGQ